MLIKQKHLEGIAAGEITLAFRRWKRPTVKAGGKLRTAIGVLAIESVQVVDAARITKRDATRAGYATKQELLDELDRRCEGKIYRIALRYAGDDPRIRLRQQGKLSAAELADLKMRLARMDTRSRLGPWTKRTLHLIAKCPEKRAPDLAQQMKMETKPFKANVRKLKELGLTESLKVGYRLSPRGKAVLKRLS